MAGARHGVCELMPRHGHGILCVNRPSADTPDSVAAVTVSDSAAATCGGSIILLHQRTVPFGSNACGFEVNLNCARVQHYQRYMFGFCCSVGRSIGRCTGTDAGLVCYLAELT